MIRTVHSQANRYRAAQNPYQAGGAQRNMVARMGTGKAAATNTNYQVTIDAPLMKNVKLRDSGRKLVLSESESVDTQNDLVRNSKVGGVSWAGRSIGLLNLSCLVDNTNAESCFQGTLKGDRDVDYYHINTVAQTFAHRPVYITMEAPEGSDCRIAVYDKDGVQVGLSKQNGDGTQTLTVPCDWSDSNCFTLKIEGGRAGEEIPYKLTFRQGEIDPEFQAATEKSRKTAGSPSAGQGSGENAQTVQELNRKRREKSEARVQELHREQYESLPEELQYRGDETVEELLARKKSGESLAPAEDIYLRIYGKLEDIADAKDTLRANDTLDKVKTLLAEAGFDLSGGAGVEVSCDGRVSVSGFSEEENELAAQIIQEADLAGELKNAYLSTSDTVKEMSDSQYRIALFTDELNRVLAKASGGSATVDDIRVADRGEGSSAVRYLEGLPAPLDTLINDPPQDSVYEDYNSMLYQVLEYREAAQESPQFYMKLDIDPEEATLKMEALTDERLGLHIRESENPQNQINWEDENVQASLQELVRQVRQEKLDAKNRIKGNPFGEVDPDGSIYRREYWTAYIGRLQEAVTHIEDYYAGAKAENSKFSVSELLIHLRNKYIDKDSPIFRSDMSAAERAMAYRQEKTLYFGKNVTLGDPYALAAHGELLNVKDMEKAAKKAAEDYLTKLVNGQ